MKIQSEKLTPAVVKEYAEKRLERLREELRIEEEEYDRVTKPYETNALPFGLFGWKVTVTPKGDSLMDLGWVQQMECNEVKELIEKTEEMIRVLENFEKFDPDATVWLSDSETKKLFGK